MVRRQGAMKARFPQIVAKARGILRLILSISLFALAFAIVFVFGMVVHGLGSVSAARIDAWLYTGALFGVFGALFGTIVVLDKTDLFFKPRGLIRTFNRPFLRTSMSAFWGALVVILAFQPLPASMPISAILSGALVGGILGWFGWRWAKYIDF